MSYEVRWRKKGTKTWHHDRVKGQKNRYWRSSWKIRKGPVVPKGYAYTKKDKHRTFKTKAEAEKRKTELQKKLGKNYEFYFRKW